MKETRLKVLNSYPRNYLMGIIVSIEKQDIDIIVLYKLLKIIYENQNISLTDLFKKYRETEGVKVNYNKVKKHIEYAALKELVEIKKGKPTRLSITKKGIDYMFLMSRVLSVLGEQI